MNTHSRNPLFFLSILLACSILFTSAPSFAQEVTPAPKNTLRKSKNGETVSKQARAELVAFQTLHGLAIGVETCLIFQCSEIRPQLGSIALGMGAGFTTSLLLSRDGVMPGQAATFNTGAAWGYWNGLLINNLFNEDDDERALGGLTLAGQAIGIGSAALVWNLFEPTSGTVSMATSGAIWTSVITLLSVMTFDASFSDVAVNSSLLAASNIGLVGGALLAQSHPMSRGRLLIIDAGGALGFFTGILGYVLVADTTKNSYESMNFRAAVASGLAGTALGLGLATFFTRDWDVDDDDTDISAQLFVTPTDGGAVVGFAGNF